MLSSPIEEAGGRITDAVNVRRFDRPDVSPGDTAEIAVAEVGILQVRSIQPGPGQNRPREIGIFQICLLEVGAAQIAAAKIDGSKRREYQNAPRQNAVSGVGCTEIGSIETCVRQSDSLQKRARNVHAHQRNAIRVKVLQSLDPAAAATFALGRVNDLPSLVILLLLTVTRFKTVENHTEQKRQSSEILQRFQKRPSAQQERGPLENPIEPVQWNCPCPPD